MGFLFFLKENNIGIASRAQMPVWLGYPLFEARRLSIGLSGQGMSHCLVAAARGANACKPEPTHTLNREMCTFTIEDHGKKVVFYKK